MSHVIGSMYMLHIFHVECLDGEPKEMMTQDIYVIPTQYLHCGSRCS